MLFPVDTKGVTLWLGGGFTSQLRKGDVTEIIWVLNDAMMNHLVTFCFTYCEWMDPCKVDLMIFCADLNPNPPSGIPAVPQLRNRGLRIVYVANRCQDMPSVRTEEGCVSSVDSPLTSSAYVHSRLSEEIFYWERAATQDKDIIFPKKTWNLSKTNHLSQGTWAVWTLTRRIHDVCSSETDLLLKSFKRNRLGISRAFRCSFVAQSGAALEHIR